jgi:Domain of Unknown Function (DUF1080)
MHSRFLALPLFLVLSASPLAHGQAPSPAAAANKAQPKKEEPLTPGGKYRAHSMDRPRPRIITPPGMSTPEKPGQPPSDATVFFGGKDLAQWKRDPKKDDPAIAPDDAAKWKVEGGYFEIVPLSGSIRTRGKIKGDCQWHIEWATPVEVKGNSQGRGNSGVFFDGFPEVQVLDSYQNDTYPDGSASGLYGAYPPMVNASRKPGEWQTYDIILETQRKDASGKVTRPARLTVIHNGIVTQWAREFDNASQEFGLGLQDHHNPGHYRNIWARPINIDNSDDEGTPPPTKLNAK